MLVPTILDRVATLAVPQGLMAWLLWTVLAALLALVLYRVRRFHPRWTSRLTLVFIALLVLTPITGLMLGVQLPLAPVPLPTPAPAPPPTTIMVLQAVPMVIAAGLLGPIPAAALGAGSGLLAALYNGGTLFSPLTYALLGALLGWLMRQRYRTAEFRWLSHPMLAAGALALLYPILFFQITLVNVEARWLLRLDIAAARVPLTALAVGVPLLVAAPLAELLRARYPVAWHGSSALVVAPGEASLRTRILSRIVPWVALWSLLVFVGSWQFSEMTLRAIFADELVKSAQLVGDGFIDYQALGQRELTQAAGDERLRSDDAPTVQAALNEALSRYTMFSGLAVWHTPNALFAAAPSAERISALSEQGQLALQHAFYDQIPFQSVSLPPVPGAPAQVAFVLTLPPTSDGGSPTVLVGMATLGHDPVSASLLAQLDALDQRGGGGALVNESGLVVYASEDQHIGQRYRGSLAATDRPVDQPGIDGGRRMAVIHPVSGYAWQVVTYIPHTHLLIAKLRFIAPVMAITLALSLVSFPLLRRFVTRLAEPIKTLTDTSSRIAGGELGASLEIDGIDEVGQLARSFEEMRHSLKAQIDEVSQYLRVSRGMASTLELDELVRPALEAALAIGADAVRLALTPAAMPEEEAERPLRMGIGDAAERLAALDKQVLALNAQQSEVFLSNPARARLVPPDGAPPAALLAAALTHEDQQLGSLWLAYERPRQVSVEESRFISTLAGQLALAVTNARLYRETQLGWQRLHGVLNASPDPVLVTNARNELIIVNPAAAVLFQHQGDEQQAEDAVPGIADLRKNDDLSALLNGSGASQEAVEIAYPELDKVYLASSSPILVNGQAAGRVCVLRDITEYKQLNDLMAEFVSAVSHDLRQPLTQIKGYAGMLGMVGELNEQQQQHLKHVLSGVERMTKQTENLLEVSRFEAGVDLRIDTFDAGDALTEIVDLVQPTAKREAIELSLELPAARRLIIQGDPAQLRSAWHNLIDNALKYTETDGHVLVSAALDGELLVVRVADNGLGIAPLDLPHIFDRFYQVRQGSKARGSGLGLSIVRAVAERHGGRVWVESQLGQGSRFTFEIPTRQAAS